MPYISKNGHFDLYTRGLKSYIWQEICTKDCKALFIAMKNARKGEIARCGLETSINTNTHGPKNNTNDLHPVTMEIGNAQLRKISPYERYKCMRKECVYHADRDDPLPDTARKR